MQPCEKSDQTYRTLLFDEYAARRSKNSSYSMRAFARDLGVSSTCLSDVLTGKRDLSRKNALRVADQLALSPEQTNALLNQLGFKADRQMESKEFLQLNDDTFRMVSDWYYFAIIALARIGGLVDDPAHVSTRLGISEFEARGAIDRLKRLGMVEAKFGKLVRTTTTLSTTRDIPSSAIRKYHRQNLKLAEETLESVPVDHREFSSITFPADLNKLKEAKDLVMDFKRKVARLMETSTASEVYTLAIQLFPVSQKGGLEP